MDRIASFTGEPVSIIGYINKKVGLIKCIDSRNRLFKTALSHLKKASLAAWHGTSTGLLPEIKESGLRTPYLADRYDLAEYYATEVAEELGGESIVFQVEIDDMSRLRYDSRAMDEPVMVDEEARDKAWEKASADHPEWIEDGMISIPPEEWQYSWNSVGSAWYDGTIPYKNIKTASLGKYSSLIISGREAIYADEVYENVLSLHHIPEDIGEGDISDRIFAFNKYELKEIPISELYLNEWAVESYLVNVIKEEIEKNPDYPPIVYDPIDKSIIDGIHRANALNELGHKTVKAYVGIGEPVRDASLIISRRKTTPTRVQIKGEAGSYDTKKHEIHKNKPDGVQNIVVSNREKKAQLNINLIKQFFEQQSEQGFVEDKVLTTLRYGLIEFFENMFLIQSEIENIHMEMEAGQFEYDEQNPRAVIDEAMKRLQSELKNFNYVTSYEYEADDAKVVLDGLYMANTDKEKIETINNALQQAHSRGYLLPEYEQYRQQYAQKKAYMVVDKFWVEPSGRIHQLKPPIHHEDFANERGFKYSSLINDGWSAVTLSAIGIIYSIALEASTAEDAARSIMKSNPQIDTIQIHETKSGTDTRIKEDEEVAAAMIVSHRKTK